MGSKDKPEYRVTKHSGEQGSDKIPGWGRRSTVARTTTAQAAQAKRQEHRARQERGSSGSYTVEQIRHRKS